MTIKILDISSIQEWLDFDKLPKEIKGVIIRCGGVLKLDGQTQYKDTCFEKFYKEAKKRNLYIGVYYVSCVNSEKDGIKEAKHCLSIIKGKQFDLPIYYDCEIKEHSTSRTGITDGVLAFVKTLSEAGYRAGLYTNPDWIKNRLEFDRLKDISIWLAQWSSGKPSINCDIWQYGHIYVNGRMVDSDYIMKDEVINKMEKVYTTLKEIDNAEMKEAVEYFIKKEVIKTNSKGEFNINQTKLECVTILYRVLKKLYIDM